MCIRDRSKNTSLAVVAPGISEALFATAIGLVAAIPAAGAYNILSGLVARYAQQLEAFAGEFITILSRQLEEQVCWQASSPQPAPAAPAAGSGGGAIRRSPTST